MASDGRAPPCDDEERWLDDLLWAVDHLLDGRLPVRLAAGAILDDARTRTPDPTCPRVEQLIRGVLEAVDDILEGDRPARRQAGLTIARARAHNRQWHEDRSQRWRRRC